MEGVYNLGNIAGAVLQGLRTGMSDKMTEEKLNILKENMGMAKEKLNMLKEQHKENIRKSKISNDTMEYALEFAKKTEELKRRVAEANASSAELRNNQIMLQLGKMQEDLDRLKVDSFRKNVLFAIQNYVNSYKKFGVKDTTQLNAILKEHRDMIDYLMMTDLGGETISEIVTPEKLGEDDVKKLLDSEELKMFENNFGIKIAQSGDIVKDGATGKQKIKFNPLVVVAKKTDGSFMPVFVPTLFGILGYDPDAETMKNLKDLLDIQKKEAEIEKAKAEAQNKRASAKKSLASAEKSLAEAKTASPENKIAIEKVKAIGNIYKNDLTTSAGEKADEFLVKTEKINTQTGGVKKENKTQIPDKKITMEGSNTNRKALIDSINKKLQSFVGSNKPKVEKKQQ